MKFKLIKEVSEPVPCYTGEMISTGDTIELEGHLAEKARNNPNYKEVKRGPNKKKGLTEHELSADHEANNDDQSGSGTASC